MLSNLFNYVLSFIVFGGICKSSSPALQRNSLSPTIQISYIVCGDVSVAETPLKQDMRLWLIYAFEQDFSRFGPAKSSQKTKISLGQTLNPISKTIAEKKTKKSCRKICSFAS